jgi:hypothetical protein
MLGTSNYRDHFKWKSQKMRKRELAHKPESTLAIGNQFVTFNGKSIYETDYHTHPHYQEQ